MRKEKGILNEERSEAWQATLALGSHFKLNYGKLVCGENWRQVSRQLQPRRISYATPPFSHTPETQSKNKLQEKIPTKNTNNIYHKNTNPDSLLSCFTTTFPLSSKLFEMETLFFIQEVKTNQSVHLQLYWIFKYSLNNHTFTDFLFLLFYWLV